MRCFLCRNSYHGALVCLECMTPYCSFECLHNDTVHVYQCKLKQAPVACTFCMDPVKYVADGFTKACGHAIHGTCAMICEHYGLQGCPECPSSDALEQMGRLMMKEYTRFCYTAIRANLPVPELPPTLMRFLVAETKSARASARELMYMLGTIFANGLGVPSDEEKAHYWLSRAAAFGHGHAMFAVSGESEQRLRIAAREGSPHACFELAEIADTKEMWLLKGLDLAPFDIQARKSLAEHYETTDVAKAFPQYFMMARQGHSESLEKLARLYYDMAVKKPLYLIQSSFWAYRALPTPVVLKTKALIALKLSYDERAFDLMQQASVGSSPTSIDALYELARFYDQGVGTTVDHDQSEQLLERAAKAGQPSAQFDLAMKRWETDNIEAMRLLRLAAKTHAVAMHVLSRFDINRELLERAGEFIPAALYDLAVRYARAADIQDTEANYRAAAELLERALAMPTPTFECAPLDNAKTTSFLKHIQKRIRICGSLQVASMDTILRLAQFTSTAVLFDIAECKLRKTNY